MTVATNLGTGGAVLDAQYGFTAAPNTNAPLLLDPRVSGPFVYLPGSAGNYVAVPHAPELNILGTEGTPFLSLPGVVDAYASTPDAAALDITGDIEIVVRVALDDWTPAAQNTLLSKRLSTLSVTDSYEFSVQASGVLRFIWSDGVVNNLKESTIAPTVVDGAELWVRATLDVDNGASGSDLKFFTSSDGIAWNQLGATVTTAGVSAIAATANDLRIGIRGTASSPAAGKVFRAIVRDGIGGTTVFDADFTQQALGSRGFIESTNKLVSLTGNAAQIVDGTTYGFLPGVAGAYWSTPDAAALDITGDIDIRVRVSMNDWTPSGTTFLLAKSDVGTVNRAYELVVLATGVLRMQWWDGAALVFRDSTVAAPFVDGQTYWVRYTVDVDNGASGHDVAFYQQTDQETEPTTWTQIGTTVTTAGTTTLTAGTAALGIGASGTGLFQMTGRMYRAIIRPNLTSGTKAFDADFTRQLQFASSFTENTGKVVTTQGVARIERARDLDIRVKVAMDDWTPGSNLALAAKMAGQKSYILMALTSGNLYFGWSTEGVTELSAQSSPTGIADGSVKWVRVTLDVNNGANGHTVSFFTSDDGTTWTPLGSPVPLTGATSIFPSTVPIEVGTYGDGALSPLNGKVYETQILNGINGPAVLDLDFSDMVTTGDETAMLSTGPGSPTIPEALRVAPNLGWGGTALNAQYGSTPAPNTNEPLLLGHDGTNYLYLPGVLNNWASTPDAATLDITGDIDIRVRVALDDWTPGGDMALVSKYGDAPNRSYEFRVLTTGRLQLAWSQDGSAVSSGQSTVSPTVPDSGELWVRVTLDVDNGAAGRDLTYFTSSDGITWTQLGSTVTQAGTTSIFGSTAQLRVGARSNGANLAEGKFYRAQILNGIGGTTVFDADFTTSITSGAQATFTESSANAATVTINRSASGRKSVAVVRPVWLFGTDDFFETPDNDLLDFGAGDSFTVVAVVRQWATPASFGYYLAKRANIGGAGYALLSNDTAQAARAFIEGASGNTANDTSAVAAGSLRAYSAVRNTSADTLQAYVNATATAASTDTTTGSLANSEVFRIGSVSGTASSYQDFELLAVAVFRRALTADEIATVNTHYQTAPSAASTALMRQSVFWVDAATRSVAQINRSTSGRKSVACADCVWLLGSDDFFEVPASPLWNFAQGEDYTLLVLHRGWWAQSTSDTLMSTSSSTTTSAAGWAMSNSSSDPWEASGRQGDGSAGITAVAPRRDIGRLTGTFIMRDATLDNLTAYTGATAGTPITDTTTGLIGNTNVMRIGRLSASGTEYLDAEIRTALVWRRKLTTAERAAVLAYYGV
jgi:hypothetical protein